MFMLIVLHCNASLLWISNTGQSMSVCIKFYQLLLSVLFQVTIYCVGVNIKISISHFAEKEYFLV